MARKRYSRLAQVESKKAKRTAGVYIILTFVLLIFLFFFGVPIITLTSRFIADLSGSGNAVEVSDTTPPAPPTFANIPSFTNQDSISINGKAEPGSTVILTINGNKREIVADLGGDFSAQVDLRDGENIISAVAVDASNNESGSSDTNTIVLDKEPPEVELQKPNDNETLYGEREKQLSIEGTTEQANRVTINDRVVVVDTSGKFSYLVQLEEGDNVFVIAVSDRAGNVTELTRTVSFVQ